MLFGPFEPPLAVPPAAGICSTYTDVAGSLEGGLLPDPEPAQAGAANASPSRATAVPTVSDTRTIAARVPPTSMGLLGEHARARLDGRAFVWAQRERIQALGIAAATFWLAYDHGGFVPEARNPFAIGVWWAMLFGVGVAVWPLAKVPREALIAGSFLAALAAWTLVSAAWAPSGETALSEFDLVALYLGIFVLTIVASRRANVEQWADGLALGIAAVAVLALASRLRPGLFPGSDDVAAVIPSSRSRLSYPIGYWNGLAALMALGVPLLLRAALAGRSLIVRPLALAGVPVLAATIYLTSSRGGAVGAVVAGAVFVALSDRRWPALGAAAIAGLGSAIAVVALADRPYLVNGNTGSLANAQGRSAALLIAALCAATAATYAVALHYRSSLRSPPVWAARALVATVALGLVVAFVASHPLRRFDHFRAPPANAAASSSVEATAHVFSSSGSGRWQFWSAAGSEFVDHPLIGGGAGSFGRWWDQHGSFAYTVEDAHSLYLETLGELGIVGFLLLLGVLCTGVVVIVRRAFRGRGRPEVVTPALVAAFAAYVLLAGIDWFWELPAVTAVAFVLLGLLVGPATERAAQPQPVPSPPRDTSAPRRSRLVPGVAALVLGWLVICAQALPLFAQLKIGESQAAVRSSQTSRALAAARAARALEPWAASPYLQLALVEEQAGSFATALASIDAAIRRDTTDWRLWLVKARLQVKAGRLNEARASLGRVHALNPRSPLLAPLYRFLSP